MAGEAEVLIRGLVYGGWKSIRVTRSLETVAGSFELAVSERWPGNQALQAILPGEACVVRLDGETLITGHVDEVAPAHWATNHQVAIAGRDRTADLVDCSAVHASGEWHGRRLDAIAADLARPFGVEVVAATDVGGPFPRFRIEEGETAFETIERACRMRAVIATGDPAGRLVLARAGTGRARLRLERGVNILEGTARITHRDRYSRYIVKSQRPGEDALDGAAIAHVRGEAVDPGITRHRPLVILAEHAADAAGATQRAAWEASVRAARARRISIIVQGWRETPDGPIWAPNRLVAVRDDWLAVDQELLITGVTLTKGDDGTRAALTLAPPDAFLPQPPAPPAEEAGWMA